jgi:AraC-like DNA-binding protein
MHFEHFVPNLHRQFWTCCRPMMRGWYAGRSNHSGGRMYPSNIVDATDPDLFVASVRPSGMDLLVTERGSFSARSTLFDLGRVYAQRCRETLRRVKRADVPRGGVMFLTAPGPSMILNGAEIGINQIAVVDAGESYNARLLGPTHWGAVTLTQEDMDAICIPEADRCTRRLSGMTVFTPLPAALARLRSLHSYMGHLAETTPKLLHNGRLTDDLEYNILAAMRDVLSTRASGLDTIGRRNHQIIADRFRTVLEAQADLSITMPAISRMIGVSGRTLRLACQEQLGISPGQYVMLRRMRSARRALQQADPDVARVTDVATEHGFWELGRFAVKYRHIFGETPSVTLKRAA